MPRLKSIVYKLQTAHAGKALKPATWAATRPIYEQAWLHEAGRLTT